MRWSISTAICGYHLTQSLLCGCCGCIGDVVEAIDFERVPSVFRELATESGVRIHELVRNLQE